MTFEGLRKTLSTDDLPVRSALWNSVTETHTDAIRRDYRPNAELFGLQGRA